MRNKYHESRRAPYAIQVGYFSGFIFHLQVIGVKVKKIGYHAATRSTKAKRPHRASLTLVKRSLILFSAGGALSALGILVPLFLVLAMVVIMKQRLAVHCVIVVLPVIALASPAIVVQAFLAFTFIPYHNTFFGY